MTKLLPALVVASYSTSAVDIIVEKTLTHQPAYKDVRVVHIPLLRSTIEHENFESLIETNFHAAHTLFETSSDATLALTITREYMSEPLSGGRHRRIFSVGLVTACYREGPLGIYSGQKWMPEDKSDQFERQAHNVLDRLQKSTLTQPSEDLEELARTVGITLVNRWHCDFETGVTAVH